MKKILYFLLLSFFIACQSKTEQSSSFTEVADEPDENSIEITAVDWAKRESEEIQRMELTSSEYIFQSVLGNFPAEIYFDAQQKLRKMIFNSDESDYKIYSAHFYNEEGKILKFYIEKTYKSNNLKVSGYLLYHGADQSVIEMNLAVEDGKNTKHITEYTEEIRDSYLENVLIYTDAKEISNFVNKEFVKKEDFLPIREDFFSAGRGVLENTNMPISTKSQDTKAIYEFKNQLKIAVLESEKEDFIRLINNKTNEEEPLSLLYSVHYLGVWGDNYILAEDASRKEYGTTLRIFDIKKKEYIKAFEYCINIGINKAGDKLYVTKKIEKPTFSPLCQSNEIQGEARYMEVFVISKNDLKETKTGQLYCY